MESVDAEFGVGEELLGLLAELDSSFVGVDGLIEGEASVFQFGEDGFEVVDDFLLGAFGCVRHVVFP